jgi:alkylation response protein AidB-like acyl-CoA dehydrogenase
MDLGLNEVQQMLKTSAQEFLSQECPIEFVRAMEEDPRGFTDGLWRQIASLGWTGLAFPEQFGGTAGSFFDLAVLLEEMGRALLPGPFFSTVVLGGLTVLDAGTEAQKQDILPQVCSGDLTMTLALTEPSVSYEPSGVETAAEHRGDSYLISGTKLFVPDAQAAEILLVVARTSQESDPARGLTVFLVPSGSPGLSISALNTISSDRQCQVILEQVSVPANSTLGPVGEGWPVVARALQRAVAGRCVEMLGGAGAVLDMTVDYVKQRTQFGRPIGSFQAVQHHCSNIALDVEGCRNIAYKAAWRVSEGGPSERDVSMAKAWVNGAYDRVCATAHQCHGAIGFTKEHDLQLYTRRGKVQELTYGDANYHKELALQYLDQ